MSKRWASALLFIFVSFVCTEGYARSLSIQIVQNTPGQEKVMSISYLFEQSVIDFFFDSGNIVSSSPIWISSTAEKNKTALENALDENRTGGMDILVRIELLCSPGAEANPASLILDSIRNAEWKGYSVPTGAEIFNGSAAPKNEPIFDNSGSGISYFAGSVARAIDAQIKNR